MKLQFSVTSLVVAGLMTTCMVAPALAQNYPSKPIKLIVPFPPGGTTDLVARIVGEHLGRELGQPVIVDNRAGAGGSIGAAAISKSEPDGYTLGIATVSTHAVNPACNPKVGYDPTKDFAPVTNIARSPNVLAVNLNFPAQDYKQFIDVVRKNPAKFSYASSGTCGLAHMMGEQFKVSTGTYILHVPYRGVGPALNDVLGGQVQIIFDNVPSSLPHIQGGKLRPIAVAWNKRLDAMPTVPTFSELGLQSVNDPAWYGLVAPPKTPAEIVKKLNAAVVKVLNLPEVKERLKAGGSEAVGNSPEAFNTEIQTEYNKMKDLVKKQGIKLDAS